MSNNILDWDFYFITDSQLTRNNIIEDVRNGLKGGAKVIQYREKKLNVGQMIEQAKELTKLCNEYDAVLLINDRVDIALAAKAHGVHLGQSDVSLSEARQLMPNGIIGVSCNNIIDLELAIEGRADYIGVSPIFHTNTKKDIDAPMGLDGIRSFRNNTYLPLIAIGGIKLENAREVIDAGADSICAISATVDTEDVEGATKDFVTLIRNTKDK